MMMGVLVLNCFGMEIGFDCLDNLECHVAEWRWPVEDEG